MPHLFLAIVSGTPVPQGRPKVAVRGRFPHVYYSKRSTDYRNKLTYEFNAARGDNLPIKRASLNLSVYGMRKNADPDNMLKQVCDALVAAKVIEDDTRENIPTICIRCIDSFKEKGKAAWSGVVVELNAITEGVCYLNLKP